MDVLKFPEIKSKRFAKCSEGVIYRLSLKRDRKALPRSPAGARALTMPTHGPSSLCSLPARTSDLQVGSGLQRARDSSQSGLGAVGQENIVTRCS